MKARRFIRRPRSPFYAELMAFLRTPTALAHGQLLHAIDALIEVLHAKHLTDLLIQARSARLALVAILDRQHRTGVLAVTWPEVLTLRTAAPSIEVALSRTRIDTFNLAAALVDAKSRAQAMAATA